MKNNKKVKKGRPSKRPLTLRERKKKYNAAVSDYDFSETTEFIDPNQKLHLRDLGFTLPEVPPTQVVSLRIPTELLNEIKALGSQKDIPYQALIKLFLSDSVARSKRRPA